MIWMILDTILSSRISKQSGDKDKLILDSSLSQSRSGHKKLYAAKAVKELALLIFFYNGFLLRCLSPKIFLTLH